MARKSDFEYLLTLKVRGRQDFEKFPAFLSVINNERFLNFAQIENDSLKGYSFARLLSVESSGNKISCAIVEDTSLGKMSSSLELRNYIGRNMNKPSLYGDTVVFYRMK